jgi:hypothetical protein
MLLTLLVAAAAAPPSDAAYDLPPPTVAAADRAGNRIEPLDTEGAAPAPGSGQAARATANYCSGPGEDRWCVSGGPDEAGGPWRLTISRRHRLLDSRPAYYAPAEPDEDAGYSVWPWLIRERGGSVLVGLLTMRGASYAGGGASATRLTLVRLDGGSGAVEPVLEVPDTGLATIRACFSEADARARRGQCEDEYELAGALRIDTNNPSAPDDSRPRLILETRARTWPGRITRDADSRDRGPLRRGDLAWWRDPECSYRRSFALDPATGRYVPDSPLPDCLDYLDIGE